MKRGSALAIASMCRLLGVSRAGYYRRTAAPRRGEMPLRDEVQRVAMKWPIYGSRRITAELQRGGWQVNRKRVQRLMREDNLLCLRKRKFVVTSDSAHGWRVYPNLAASLVMTTINQLWVADITYIRLLEEFIFLAVILDAFSRRVLGWELGESLQTSLAIRALDRAVVDRRVPAGIIHHSDQGVQYASV